MYLSMKKCAYNCDCVAKYEIFTCGKIHSISQWFPVCLFTFCTFYRPEEFPKIVRILHF